MKKEPAGRGTRNSEGEGEGEEAKRKIHRERLHSSEVNFVVNYNSGKVWPRYVLVAYYAKQFYSFPFPFFAPPFAPSPPFPICLFLQRRTCIIFRPNFPIYRTFVHRNWGSALPFRSSPGVLSRGATSLASSPVICGIAKKFHSLMRPSTPSAISPADVNGNFMKIQSSSDPATLSFVREQTGQIR